MSPLELILLVGMTQATSGWAFSVDLLLGVCGQPARSLSLHWAVKLTPNCAISLFLKGMLCWMFSSCLHGTWKKSDKIKMSHKWTRVKKFRCNLSWVKTLNNVLRAPGSRGAENSEHVFSTWGKENVELWVSLWKILKIFICLYTLIAREQSLLQSIKSFSCTYLYYMFTDLDVIVCLCWVFSLPIIESFFAYLLIRKSR